jgi:hypothetical protein
MFSTRSFFALATFLATIAGTAAAAAQSSEPSKSPIQSLNPDISVILDGTAGFQQRSPTSSAGDDPSFDGDSATRGGGMTIQEAEVAISSVVDPYFKGDLALTIPNSGSLEIEEGFLTTTSLPFDLQIKAGKFRSSLGRQNGQHLHMQDFTRRPLINQNFLGVDGLSAPGVQVSWLVPLPFYSLLSIEGLQAKAPEEAGGPVQTFGGGKSEVAQVATLKNFFPLGDDTSLYLGLNYAQGRSVTIVDPATGAKPPSANLPTRLVGADIYLKWKPSNVSGGYQSLAFQGEYFRRFFLGDEVTASTSDGGYYGQLVYQFARNWWAGYRYDQIGAPTSPFVKNINRHGASLTFGPSEFSRLRLYADNETVKADDFPSTSPASSNSVLLQYEISMGAHGAHPF